MKTKKKKKVYEVYCPYCRKRARVVTRRELYGDRKDLFFPDEKVWICGNYGKGCDALVTTYYGTEKPKGELANAALRKKRTKAHEAIEEVVNAGILDFHSVYDYLEDKFGMYHGKFHLAKSSDYYCDETIRLMNELMEQRLYEGRK